MKFRKKQKTLDELEEEKEEDYIPSGEKEVEL